MEAMFYPRSVAIVGASARENQFTHGVVKGLRESGFPGPVYPINPRLEELLGFRAYPTVLDVPGPVDLAMIGVPLQAVLQVVHQCGRKGVAAVVIFSGGFAEVGGRGEDLEREVIDAAHSYGMRVMGPNCFGVACADSKLTYREGVPLAPGRGGLICQSGSMAWSLALLGAEHNVYFGKTASIGNSGDLDATDFLEYMGGDERIDFICLYLEGLRDGRRFYRVLKDTCRRKPVVMWKAGRTPSGSRAAASHTAALSGENHVFRAVARQAGAMWCQNLAEMVDLLAGVQQFGIPSGRRIGVISAPGGAGVVTADACEEHGLPFAAFRDETVERLKEFLPPIASPRNPVDLTGFIFEDMGLYTRSADVVAEDDQVDMLFILGPSEIGPEEFSRRIAAGAPKWRKPTLVAWIASDKAFQAGAGILRAGGIACYSDPNRAAWTVARLLEYGRFRSERGYGPWGGVAGV